MAQKGLGEFAIHRACCMQEDKGATYIMSLFNWLAEQGGVRDNKNTAKGYKSHEVVESHDRTRPEGTQHIEKRSCFPAPFLG